MRIVRILYCIIILLTCWRSWGESLWTGDFQGYLSGEPAVQVGDIIMVELDAALDLSFSSSTIDSKNITLEFSGGEFGDLFSFLPVLSAGGTQSLKGEEEFSIKTLIGTRIMEVDPSNKALVQGTRRITFGGKEQSLTLTGWVDPKSLGPERKINFSHLADAQLQFRTLLQPAADTISLEDIEEIIEPVVEPTGEGAIEPAAAGEAEPEIEPGAAAVESAVEMGKRYQLSEARKKELFLIYVNRLVDLIFQE